jgi:hypothetical protein
MIRSPELGGKADLRPNQQIVRKRISSLKPSPENERIYRRVADDADLRRLAESIAKDGLFQPLVITEDNFLVSGHRRLAALQLNGQKWANCIVLPKRRDSMTTDEYIALLREHNVQRHKTVAEQVREEMIDIDPEEAFRNLRKLRDKSIYAPEHNSVTALKIEGEKHRCLISDQKADHVRYVKKVVFEDRRNYWPLSVRGVHYALRTMSFCATFRGNYPTRMMMNRIRRRQILSPGCA